MRSPVWVKKVAGSRHTATAVRTAKVLSLLGTIRGAVATVVLIASAAGGVFTVQTVRSDIAADHSPRPTRQPATASPTINPSALVQDAQQRLRNALDSDEVALDDIRKIAVLPAAQLNILISEGKAKLEARYRTGLDQIAKLTEATPTPGPAETPAAAPSFSVVALNALVAAAISDMNGIVFGATKVATGPTPRPTIAPTPPPSRTPPPTPFRTPTPTPPHTPTPTPKL